MLNLVFPHSENSGGHNHEHNEKEEVCKILKFNVTVKIIFTFLSCHMLFAMLMSLIGCGKYILLSVLIHLNLLQHTSVENGADDDNKRSLFRQHSDMVICPSNAGFRCQRDNSSTQQMQGVCAGYHSVRKQTPFL